MNISSVGKLCRRANRYATNIIIRPPITPGRIPATKSSTTELPDMTPYRIIGIEGGMMTAKVAEDDVTAAAKGLE